MPERMLISGIAGIVIFALANGIWVSHPRASQLNLSVSWTRRIRRMLRQRENPAKNWERRRQFVRIARQVISAAI